MKLLTSFLCALCVLCGSSGSAAAAQKPNIIVILADDLGYGDIGCYGAKDIATPQIDQMARDGAKFTPCYVAPVCSPTRASLMMLAKECGAIVPDDTLKRVLTRFYRYAGRSMVP